MLLLALPHWRRYFLSERWGGYGQSDPSVDLLQSPIGSTTVAATWFCCAVLISSGTFTVAAAAINLLLCRYFFVQMRWKGLLRGFGAPGFMAYWTGLVLFLLELTAHYAPEQFSLALLVAQVDFASIMLSAGFYKLKAGYADNNGIEYGLANPQWSWWSSFYKDMPPGHALFKVLNHLSWSGELVAGLLMLAPPTRFIGGLLILASFLFVSTQIRLGVLCQIVMLDCFLFFHPSSPGDVVCRTLAGASTAGLTAHPISMIAATVKVALWSYLALLPFAHAGLAYNFYKGKVLPEPVQSILEKYTNFFGIIIWRVFSADHTNFFPFIYKRKRGSEVAPAELVSNYSIAGGLRFFDVGESIVLTCLFTTLKYYASNKALFQERLIRYARTIPCERDCVLEFVYMQIHKSESNFEYVPAVSYKVDLADSSVTELRTEAEACAQPPGARSLLQEGIRPGSYAPLR